jgi:periplasmic protein TonB
MIIKIIIEKVGTRGSEAGVAGGVEGGQEGGVVGSTGQEPLQLSEVMRPPRVLSQVRPEYPRAARLSGIQGLVVVRIVIGADGQVERERTQVLRSVPALDASAVEAIARWRFAPAVGRDGRPVRVIVDVPLNFSLR